MLRKCLTIAACAGLVACAHPPAAANVTQAVWISNTQFAYRVNFVPDFDQRRTTLPVNGSNYCVPTSFINWAGYIARRGNPGQLPGAPPWGYVPITLNILLLGNAMNTDPNGGTGPSGGVAGASQWLAGRAFCIVVTGNTTNGFPRLRTLANNAINNNCLVVPRIGWYNESNLPRITRTGGHAVSMVRANAAGSANQLIGIHDPAWTPAGDTQSVQSQFTMNQYAVEERVVFEGSSALPTTMSRIVGYGSGYIYGAYYILPYVVLTPVNFNFQILSASFENAGVQTTTISNPNLGTITGVFPGMEPSQIFYTADNAIGTGGRLVRYDRADDTHSLIMTLGSDFVDACPSRFDTIFVLQGRTLSRVNPNNPTTPVEASLVIGTGIDSMAYDDKSDRIFALRSAARQVLRVPGALGGGTSSFSIPTQIPVAPGGEIDVLPGDGSVLIATPGSTSAFRVIPSDIAAPVVQTITIPGNTFPITGGSFTDRGAILVANGLMKEMVLDENGVWSLDTASPFHNRPASSGKIYAGRSRADVDRATENDPENQDVIAFDFSGATHVIACPADVNGDGVVNFADLNAVLTSYGQTGANPPGDTDGDGDVDFTDLNTVLTNFGVDCG
jgi:hypothetical protein